MGWLPSIAVLLLALAASADGKKVAVKEVVFDSPVRDIQWLGEDDKTVLVQTTNGRLYRSINGGEKWNEISDQLQMEPDKKGGPEKFLKRPIQVHRMIRSKAEPNTIVVIGTHGTHYISNTRGNIWRRIKHQSKIHTFIFHKTRPKWALLSTWTDACEAPKAGKKPLPPVKKEDADEDTEGSNANGDDNSACAHMLYITKDLGRTFKLVVSYVVQFSWGHTAKNQQDRIYFTHFRKKEGDQDKLYIWSPEVDFGHSDDAGSHIVRSVYHGNKFLISNGFIFVAKLKDTKSQTVTLMCSNDGGRSFRQAQLPQDLDEKSYTVLDTSEGAVMIHVNHGTKEPPFNVGNVYVSDALGVRYTLSLPNNVRSSGGDCEFDKVLCLEGVYMANFRDTNSKDDEVVSQKEEKAKEAEQVEEEASAGTQVEKKHAPAAKTKDETVVRTVISFDNGGGWSYLKPPKVDSLGKKVDCPEDKCWLHLHGITNFNNYAPFYSIENAIGIIMGTGNVGPYLRFEPDQINTYLSRDGGLTWVEAHKGAFIYEFGDHGGLLVMADDVRKTKQVVFSWNEGQSWYDFELSEFPVDVDNVMTEPNATATKFLLYGTRGSSGVMYHLDFEALGQPLCKGVWAADSVSSDYETWTPSDGKGTEKCLLGRQITYTRRKQSSECFNGEKFERPTNRKNCACTQENFECEMGFTRKVGSTECKYADDGLIPVSEQCTSSSYYHLDAYRKVIGDTCEGGWEPKKAAVPCPRNAKLSRGAMSVLGTFSILALVMGGVTFLSKSEKFKHFFANYGFENFGDVKYATIGGKTPETALESVGTRFDADFIEGEGDFDDDAPQLMSYTGGRGGNERDRDRDDHRRDDRRDDRREIPRRIETAAAQVPKLQKPPSAVPADDDSLDLL